LILINTPLDSLPILYDIIAIMIINMPSVECIFTEFDLISSRLLFECLTEFYVLTIKYVG